MDSSGLLLGNHSLLNQLNQSLIEGLHPLRRAALDSHGELVHPVLPDELDNGRGGNHNLDRGNTTLPVGPGDESLAGNRPQVQGEKGSELSMLRGRKEIQQPIYRLHYISRMKSADDQMPGFRGR